MILKIFLKPAKDSTLLYPHLNNTEICMKSYVVLEELMRKYEFVGYEEDELNFQYRLMTEQSRKLVMVLASRILFREKIAV